MVRCKVAAIGFAGLVMLLSAGTATAQERATTTASPQERVTTACRAAEDAFATGDVNGGCKTLLDTLRAMDPDNAQLVDLTTAPQHLLIFGMCSLMHDEALVAFLEDSLDPETHPVDDAVLLYFNLQFKSFAEGRGLPEPQLSEQVQRAQRMAQSPRGLVRALGLVALSWYAPGSIVGESTRNSFNSLAELCPEAKSTREVLHRLLLVTSGDDPAHSQAARDLVSRSDWNPAVQALLANDPVVDLVREVTTISAPATLDAEKSATAVLPADSGITTVLTAAQNQPEMQVKDWCLRLVHAHTEVPTTGTTAFCEAVRVQSEPVAKSGAANLKSTPVATVTVQPLETLRARHVLFSQALKAQDLIAAGAHLDALLNATSAEEPLDANTTLNTLLDAMEYGLRLVMAGDYAKALTAYERVTLKYPSSEMGTRAQEHVDHIKSVLASQQK